MLRCLFVFIYSSLFIPSMNTSLNGMISMSCNFMLHKNPNDAQKDLQLQSECNTSVCCRPTEGENENTESGDDVTVFQLNFHSFPCIVVARKGKYFSICCCCLLMLSKCLKSALVVAKHETHFINLSPFPARLCTPPFRSLPLCQDFFCQV